MKIVFQNHFKYEIHNNYLWGSKYLMRAVDGKQGIDKCQPNPLLLSVGICWKTTELSGISFGMVVKTINHSTRGRHTAVTQQVLAY